MAYIREQYAVDCNKGVFRVNGVCFEDGTSDQVVATVLEEVSNMNVVESVLMTREALCRYINAPEDVSQRMASMPVGTSFEYSGLLITRWSNLTYNGKALSA